MFQPAPKRCFTIESLVAKDSPLPASRSEDPIRPAALSYANSSPINPFLNGFHSAAAAAAGRGVYSNPDLVFAEAVSHPPNPAVPVHPVPPPHALAAHPLPSSHSPHPLFASQQRDPSTFYPWLIHRYRYLGHRFQGTCHVAGLQRAASLTTLGLLGIGAWRGLDGASSGSTVRARRLRKQGGKGPGTVLVPSLRAAAGLGAGLRLLVPFREGCRQRTCSRMFSGPGRLSQAAPSACQQGIRSPRGPQALRLLREALDTQAPRGRGQGPAARFAFDCVRSCSPPTPSPCIPDPRLGF